MIRSLRKTSDRTGRFLGNSLTWRVPDRQYGIVAWCLIGGTIWGVVNVAGDPEWRELAFAGFSLLAILAAVCAIDARYGIIPDSLVIALAACGLLQASLSGQGSVLLWCGEALLVFTLASLFRAGYRWVRGHDGLGFGDVKFVTAAVLWIGIEGIPGLLLVAVVSAMASLMILKADGHELHGRQAISFGPHLAVGLWAIWISSSLQLI